ncbi:unnamed protein product [Plasmodium vivax]|uniref:(malaria parasite P. vivax) hypothetical protein n=1 Tax=Plasmodium vivax TaxID=5855 RepID=A0A8S4HID8_PLAVI|nr:unnamed protein product [Plasmodium vivax]
MGDSNQDYNTFEHYKYNHGVYKKNRGDVGDDYDSFPDGILGEQAEKKHSITRDCLRLSKYLMNFHSVKECKIKNCCQYINYLLNKTARIYNDSNESIFEIYIKYMKHNNNNNNNDIINLCLPEIKYMDLDEYDKIDSLYTAYEVCQFYISNKNDRMSCKRAKLCANAYNNIMTVYTKRNDTKFCKILKDLNIFLEANEPMSTGDCSSRFSALLSYPPECNQLLKEAEKPNAPVDQRNGRLDEQEKLQEGVTGEAPEKHRQEQPGMGAPQVDRPGVGIPGEGIGKEASNTLHPTQFTVEDINGNPPNTNIPIPAGTILYTSLGSILPLVTLYRFTPLGSWINTKILRRNKLMENMTKNNYDLLLNDVGNHEASLNDSKYHIRYNSATNH